MTTSLLQCLMGHQVGLRAQIRFKVAPYFHEKTGKKGVSTLKQTTLKAKLSLQH